ncbi:Uncharacterised protein [Dermatophilus congolensis]|uniref:CARDB n=3 Tax=Dermatophilus congolensis TaxID=1863 RepID=A0A239V897_9MICO|nr:DUF6049 family protein [Dermatophilus congolensis]SNV18417.1 Uncharacterised protein [Dermatophilus congolensis]
MSKHTHRALTALILAAILTGISTPAATSNERNTTQNPLELALTRVTPTIATPGEPVTIRATLTNRGNKPLPNIQIRALLGNHKLTTRSEINTYTTSNKPLDTTHVATSKTPITLPPGKTQTTTLTIDGNNITTTNAYDIRPLILEATTPTTTTTTRSFLPTHTRKEYQPLQLGFLIPLTADPDPHLVTATGEELDKAWTEFAGPGSRIDNILSGTKDHTTTYALDPTLLAPNTTPPATKNTETPDVPTQLTKNITKNITTPTSTIWQLPPTDPDIDPLTTTDANPNLLKAIGKTNPQLGKLLTETGAPPEQARAADTAPLLAWPIDNALTTQQRTTINNALHPRNKQNPTTYITDNTHIDPDPDRTGPASRRTPKGNPLLVSDSGLNNLLNRATNPTHTGEITQQFLAETLSLLSQNPSKPRDVLVTAPRGFNPNPNTLHTLLTDISNTPWITLTNTNDFLQRTHEPETPTTEPPNHTPNNNSPITPNTIEDILDANCHLNGLETVLTPTNKSTLIPTTTTTHALASARWRGQPTQHDTALTTTTDRIHTLTTGVNVLPSTVNFLADSGVLQVTIVNNLDVAVHDVRLILEPDQRTPRLHITQPTPLSISPKSRTTVKVPVEAIAAGLVPISTHLQTAAGTRLGTDATVKVRVQPSGGITITIGAILVALIFTFGLARTIRRGRTRVTDADIKGVDLE